jgi:hypothetical protein
MYPNKRLFINNPVSLTVNNNQLIKCKTSMGTSAIHESLILIKFFCEFFRLENIDELPAFIRLSKEVPKDCNSLFEDTLNYSSFCCLLEEKRRALA